MHDHNLFYLVGVNFHLKKLGYFLLVRYPIIAAVRTIKGNGKLKKNIAMNASAAIAHKNLFLMIGYQFDMLHEKR
jgi:hypothetical protein